MDFVATTLLLFIVLDPLGNVPLFLSYLRAVPEPRRRRVLIRELLVAYVLLVVFLFSGTWFMQILALDLASVRIAGGVVLFLIALRMVFPPTDRHGNSDVSVEPFIVPLAVPAVAGPAALSVLVLLRGANPDATWLLLGALSSAWLLSSLILLVAAYLQRLLRTEGMLAMERLMGLILVVIAVQMMIDALRSLGALPPAVAA